MVLRQPTQVATQYAFIRPHSWILTGTDVDTLAKLIYVLLQFPWAPAFPKILWMSFTAQPCGSPSAPDADTHIWTSRADVRRKALPVERSLPQPYTHDIVSVSRLHHWYIVHRGAELCLRNLRSRQISKIRLSE